MADVQKAQLGVQRSDDGQFVHFGVIEGDAFIVFASQRSGDYDEAIAAAAEAANEAKKKG